jgi:hypothetical protein
MVRRRTLMHIVRVLLAPGLRVRAVGRHDPQQSPYCKKPIAASASNIHSQIVNGFQSSQGLDASASDQGRGDLSMSDEHIALLISLAQRPSLQVAANIQPMVDALVDAGCVSYTSSGWTATARGCALVEEKRSTRVR